jgi:hypothetical protein
LIGEAVRINAMMARRDAFGFHPALPPARGQFDTDPAPMR